MSPSEIDLMKYGEMIDLLNCLSIYQGAAKPKKKMTYDQIMMLR